MEPGDGSDAGLGADPRVGRWPVGPERELLATRVFSITAAEVRSPTREGVSFEAVRLRCPDWVNVIALTPAGDVVLIEQWRHGTQGARLEIPGGMADPGESPAEAIARELLEETGYVGDPVHILGTTEPNPAIQDNRLHTGLVTRARQVQAAAGDGHEEIAVRVVTQADMRELIRSGGISHALVVAAWALFELGGGDAVRAPAR